MSSRRLLLAANWKMNPPPASALQAAMGDHSKNPYHPHSDIDVVIFPTFLDLHKTITANNSNQRIVIGTSKAQFVTALSVCELEFHVIADGVYLKTKSPVHSRR